MSGRRFVVDERADGFALVESASGSVAAFVSNELRGSRIARLVDVLALTDEQIDALLNDRRLLRTIPLKHADICRRCGRPMKAGSLARWNAETKLVQHVRRCPRSAATRRSNAAA